MNAPDERWIVVNKWDEFQHPDALRTGNIPWLKTFTRLLSDDAYLGLNAGERAVLHGIWLEYARSRGQLRLAHGSLTRRLNLKVRQEHLDALNHAGFIHFSASKPASTIASTPASTEETRRERSSRTRATPRSKPTELDPYFAANPHVCPKPSCALRFPSARRLEEHIENVHWNDKPEATS